MTKTELIGHIASETVNIPKTTIDRVIKSMCDVIRKSDETTIIGFGTFRRVIREAHKARNPKTGEVVDVPEKTVLKFKASK
jgi:nucleoid DNA-binding protein